MKTLHRNLTVQVLVAISLGVLLGLFAPGVARGMRPVGDTFVNLVRMVIAPVIFLTVTLGIANMQDLKKVGRVGGKALLYFEIVTTFALAIGMVVVNVTKPGAGARRERARQGGRLEVRRGGEGDDVRRDPDARRAGERVDAFARGDVLQIVFFAVLFGQRAGVDRRARAAALTVLDVAVARDLPHRRDGDEGRADRRVRRDGVHRSGTFGAKSLLPLGRLMLDVYITMALFIFVGPEPDPARLRLLALALSQAHPRGDRAGARHLVVGAALPRMLEKMERYGCAKSVVGLVIPRATRSTSTARRSTCRWRRCSSRRRSTCT
jgi:aerobic C4-dicarboxylate transport protein